MSEISTILPEIAPSGALFVAGVFLLFGWGVIVGLIGAFADAPPFRAGGHAPGARGSYDPRGALHPDRAA